MTQTLTESTESLRDRYESAEFEAAMIEVEEELKCWEEYNKAIKEESTL